MTDCYERIRAALAMGPTPGPWTAKSHAAPRADNGDIGIINGKGMLVAVAYSNRCARGNASLIAACDADTIRALVDERDALLDALLQIAEWPDGGNRYGQGNIKRFAQAAIDAAMRKENSND